MFSIAFSGCAHPGPMDATLRAIFVANRNSFEQLHEMMQADRNVMRVGDDIVGDIWLDFPGVDSSLSEALESEGMSQERYNAYMALLRQIGAYRVSVDFYDDNRSIIGMHRSGNVAESQSVDIVHAEKPPEPIVEETIAATRADNTSGCAKLADSWYICRVHD